jgi:hypothetical protein
MTTTVTILRLPYDCTNGGVSSKHDKLLVIGAGDAAPHDAAYPVMVLTQHAPGQVSLRPLHDEPGRVGPMAGGNYAAGDKAFNQAVEKLLGAKFYGAVAIHDRFESQELADQLGH